MKREGTADGGEIRACEVCQWVDKDETPKPVYYCSLCDAWICKACIPDIPKRGTAMVLRGKAKGIEWLKGILAAVDGSSGPSSTGSNG